MMEQKKKEPALDNRLLLLQCTIVKNRQRKLPNKFIIADACVPVNFCVDKSGIFYLVHEKTGEDL